MIQLKLGVVWFVLLTRHPACLVCHQVALGVCASRPRRDARTLVLNRHGDQDGTGRY